MNKVAEETVKPLILSVLTTVLVLILGNGNDWFLETSAKANAAASKERVRELEKQVANHDYRLDQVEGQVRTQDGRQRRNTGNINRLCQIADIVCSSQNARAVPPVYRHDWVLNRMFNEGI